MMSKKYILNENRDFLRLYRRGGCIASPVLVTYCMRNRLGYNRYGITATKKIGGAVQRNRAKRLVRAAFRELSPGLPAGWDFVFVCRGRTPHCKSPQVTAVMKKHVDNLVVSHSTPGAARTAKS